MPLFQKNLKEFANDLLGRTLVAGSVQASILEVRRFPRKTNDTPHYRPMLTMRPGEVFTPMHRGSAILPLIVCNDSDGETGACVLIQSVEVNGEVVEKPGAVSKALGLTIPKDPGRVEERDDGTLVLVMARLGPPALRPKSARIRAGNGIGNATLTKHFPAIIKKYKKDRLANPGIRFNEYLNSLLKECGNERDLRRLIRA